jgi:hypothetical protein
MSSQVQDAPAQAAAIVARISRTDAARELAVAYQSHAAAFEPLPEESRAYVVSGLERGLERFWRFMSTRVMPPTSDFELLHEWTRARAAEGIRLEDLLWLFGLAHQWGLQVLRQNTRSDESDGLIELAGLVAEYFDRVSAVITEAYVGWREQPASEEELYARTLLDRLCVDSPLDASDRELADRLGVPVDCPYSPFAIVMPGRPPYRHAGLAARLRRDGWGLTVAQGDRVIGLTWKPLDLSHLNEGQDVLLATGWPTPRGELAAAGEELSVLIEHAREIGLRGQLDADDYLFEILLGRSPRLAGRLSASVLGPLHGDDHGELAHTLKTLLGCRLDRTTTSAALHIHRNTLAYRLRRIEEITGLDIANPRDLTRLYLAIGAESPDSRP